MYYKIGGKRVNLTVKEFLGEGGEATVYKLGNKAIKILKPQALGKIAKIEEMVKIANLFPTNVLAPQELVLDTSDRSVGFVTNFGNGQDLILLARPGWKNKNGLDNNFVQDFFKALHNTVLTLHQRLILIGDFNYNNLLFGNVPGEHYLLDVDSMSFEIGSQRYLCSAMHPWFFDPTLKELLEEFKRISSSPGLTLNLSKPPEFTNHTDWYSYNVLLFIALFCIHPFKGTHRGYSTEFQRMEARYSVFKSDVIIPKSLIPLDRLNDDLAQHFVRTFEQDYRGVFPLNLFTQWKKCSSCNIEYNRRVCPNCQTGATTTTAVTIRGKCYCQNVFSTNGRIITTTYQDKLRFLYEEGGILKREKYLSDNKLCPNGVEILSGSPTPSHRLTIELNRTWLGGGVINSTVPLIPIEWNGPNRSGATNTGVMGKAPVFDSNSTTCFTLSNGFIVNNKGENIGQVLENKTWFKIGEHLGFGFYRVGEGISPFMWRIGERSLIPLNCIPNPDGKMLDMTAYFSKHNILFAISVEKGGQLFTELHLIDADKYTLIASIKGEATSQRVLNSIYGKAIYGTRILTSTDDGLLTLEIAQGTLIERSLLSDTEPFVKAGNEIWVHSANQIFVIDSQEIRLLTLG